MLLPEPLCPTSPIISPGSMTRSMPRMMARLPYRKPAPRNSMRPSTLPSATGLAGSGTLDTWSRISKIRLAPAAAFCVTDTMRLIESSRR